MAKIRVGNKQNSILNGEWGGHVRSFMKRVTSGIRRAHDRQLINQELDFLDGNDVCPHKRAKKRKYKKQWIKEWRWISLSDYNTYPKRWFDRDKSYTEDWQMDTWGKSHKPRDIEDAIKSDLRSKYSSQFVKGRSWRARNVITGEIVEFPDIENYYNE